MRGFIGLFLLLAWQVALGQEPLSEDKPFAEAHVILQVSQNDTTRCSLVLDIANNLTRHYGGQDMVDIEILAQDNERQARIESLMAHGVRFYVCGNTLDSIERRTQTRPALLPGVEMVQTGVAFMIAEITKRYAHVQS